MNPKLKILSENLKTFRPDLQNYFICPTCLEIFPTTEEGKNITQAHIIPKSAGGRDYTFLCKKCNNLFGTKQDKWFGEIIKMVQRGSGALLGADIKDGYFWIDGIKANGFWRESDTGSLNFYIDKNRNSPSNTELILKKFANKPPSVNLKMSFPLLRNRELAEIGSLTAAYLMWFEQLGYSWVFQKHLDIVRKQILNPEKELLGGKYLAHIKGIEWDEPWIGLINAQDMLIPVMGFLSHFVLLPPRDCTNFHEAFGDDLSILNFDTIRRVEMSLDLEVQVAVSIMVEQNLIIAPDIVFQQPKVENVVVFFPPGSTEPRLLVPVTEEESDRIRNLPNTQSIKIKLKE